MALPFNRNFKNGRQSEQFLNDELITLYEALKYLSHHKEDHEGEMPPAAKLNGAINAQPSEESLNYWDASHNQWVPFFKSKFQITDQMLVQVCPANPVVGQLWINNGVLCYFDGAEWHPIKSVNIDDSQWSNAAFADFELISPLNPIGQYVVPIESGFTGQDTFVYNYASSFVVADPSVVTYRTDKPYRSGQSELTVHLNGLLIIQGRDFEELSPAGEVPTERSSVCQGIKFKCELRAGDVISYHISRKMIVAAEKSDSASDQSEDYRQYFLENEIDYINDNIVIPSEQKWSPGWISPELSEPQELIIPDEYRSQFPVPNLNYDRIFLDNILDDDYDRISSVCFQYPTNEVLGHTLSAIHLNPGKVTGITKRLVKVDKLNATIAVSPYNTEFYGFRTGEIGGEFLIPSDSQDYGDYMPVGDHIVLNYHSNQNYDYIMAITYEFTWMKADGSMTRTTPSGLNNSFYLTNLHTPLNVHVNGLKLEEASYDVDMTNRTFTIHDQAENVEVAAWSPFKKQFGYIRETDLLNRGIIRLHEPVHAPLVFVGGTLIHPLFGGLVFEGDKIYVPNSGNVNQMKNMAWCVVDLVSDNNDVQFGQYGYVEETTATFQSGDQDEFVPPDQMYYAGTLSDDSDDHGIYDYILGSGTVSGVSDFIIRYNPNDIGPNDGILLFIDGLLIYEDDIIRDPIEGTITIVGGLSEDQEYVLLKDRDGLIYSSTNMLPAFSTGYLSESLIYLNGKLLGNTNCVTTLNTPAQEIKNGAVDHEIRYFITDETTGAGVWKIYDQYTYTWRNMTTADRNAVLLIVGSYENMLTSVKINVEYDKDTDEVVVYTFKFANDLVGLTEVGEAVCYGLDEDEVPIFTLGSSYYGYNMGMLNVYKNGVKLLPGRDYEEMSQGKMFRLLTDYEQTDTIQYVIEMVERGYEYGHTTLTLTKDEALQTNIYRLPDHVQTSLYPGRLTVYINGIRIPNTDWSLLTNRSILLKYTDYKAVGSAFNYPEEDYADEHGSAITITHSCPDEITVEIRYDYDRKEKTIFIPAGTSLNELSIEEYGIDQTILESKDEILFFLNGQFTGLTRNRNDDYRLDRYNGCISFFAADFIEAAIKDEVQALFDQDNYIYTAWKQMTGNSTYTPNKENALTIVWRE